MIMIMHLSTQACGSNKEKSENKVPRQQRNCRARVATVSSQATGVTTTDIFTGFIHIDRVHRLNITRKEIAQQATSKSTSKTKNQARQGTSPKER